MHTLTIYHTVSNNGDGSASTRFFESKKLAQWDIDQDEEGFCDAYVDSLTFSSESPISGPRVMTAFQYLIENYRGGPNSELFLQEFYPNGLPPFTVEIKEGEGAYKDISDVKVFVEGKKVAEVSLFCKNAEKLEEQLKALK